MASKESIYKFSGSRIIMSLPEKLGGGVFPGELNGSWTTRRTALSKFDVTDVDAALSFAEVTLPLPGQRTKTTLRDVRIPLTMKKVGVPTHLREDYPSVNTGGVARKSARISVVMGLEADLSSIPGQKLEPVDVVLRSQGYLETGGAFNMSGIAEIVSGWLAAALLACGGCGKGSWAPVAICPVTMATTSSHSPSTPSAAMTQINLDTELDGTCASGGCTITAVTVTKLSLTLGGTSSADLLDPVFTGVIMSTGVVPATVTGEVFAGQGGVFLSDAASPPMSIEVEYTVTTSAGETFTFTDSQPI